MLKRMTTRNSSNVWPVLACLLLLAAGLALSACSGAGGLTDDKFAWRVEGGALTEYGGADGGDADARNTMRLVLVGRQFDITPVDSHTVETGAAESYRAGADTDYADATGTQTQFGDEMTMAFTVTSTDVNITGMQLTGVFSKTAAEGAIADPSDSFVVTWTLSFEDGGEARELTAQQSLIGVNYILD